MINPSANLHILLEKLRSAQISSINLDTDLFSLKLNFVFAPEEHSIIIDLLNLISFSISRTPDDEGCYNVYQVSLESLEDGGEETLAKLGYAFGDKDNHVFPYSGRPLFHFELEGDVCLDIVCTSYQIYEASDEYSGSPVKT